MASSPQYPVVNAGAMYINGLELSPSTPNPELDFNVQYGAARNSTNVNDIILRENLVVKMTKRGALGLDVGVIAADTIYAVYVIGSSIASLGNGQDATPYPTSAIVSKSFTHPIMPFGYDMFRRIGTITTDATVQIMPFIQTGNSTIRTIHYGAGFNVLTNGNETTFTSVDLSLAVPKIQTLVYFRSIYATDDTFNNFSLQPGSALDDSDYYIGQSNVAGEAEVGTFTCPCDSEPSINYSLSDDAVGNSLTLIVMGFEDLL